MPNSNVCLVLRTAGERTAELARKLVESQKPYNEVFVIQEVPFGRAVEKTFEIGIESGKKWTIGMDADVLLTSKAIATLVNFAESRKDYVFEVEGRLFDKLFGGPRWCGLHLYRTAMLDRALEIAKRRDSVHRPEFHVISGMHEAGFTQVRSNAILGIHDFEQDYTDYYRKGFVHAQKHSQELRILLPTWKFLARCDADFAAVLCGVEAGAAEAGIASTDVSRFESISKELDARNFLPKDPIRVENFSADEIVTRLKLLKRTKAFRMWEAKTRAYRIREILYAVVPLVPPQVRKNLRGLMASLRNSLK